MLFTSSVPYHCFNWSAVIGSVGQSAHHVGLILTSNVTSSYLWVCVFNPDSDALLKLKTKKNNYFSYFSDAMNQISDSQILPPRPLVFWNFAGRGGESVSLKSTDANYPKPAFGSNLGVKRIHSLGPLKFPTPKPSPSS